MKKKVIIVLVLLALLVLVYSFSPGMRAETFEVRGDSLAGLIKEGQVIEVDFDFYLNNLIERKDVVLYSYAGNEAPLIKIVYAIPGDIFSLEKGKEGEHLKVNGGLLRNSEGELFEFDERRAKLLSLYIKDYKSAIPENSYLILGNDPRGSMDSSRFGLVSKDDILAKVLKY